MPVDPGNLLLLGADGRGVSVIGLPGCARSPKLNGIDWVLQRLLAGLDVAGTDLATMGAGGLLRISKEIFASASASSRLYGRLLGDFTQPPRPCGTFTFVDR